MLDVAGRPARHSHGRPSESQPFLQRGRARGDETADSPTELPYRRLRNAPNGWLQQGSEVKPRATVLIAVRQEQTKQDLIQGNDPKPGVVNVRRQAGVGGARERRRALHRRGGCTAGPARATLVRVRDWEAETQRGAIDRSASSPSPRLNSRWRRIEKCNDGI